MKIVFNLSNVGLGNNGGSHTIVQSAKYLAQLGAEVVLFGPYKYTWDEKPENVTIVENGKITTCDVIIATGQSSVKSTIEHKRCNKKFWWVRGHEVWSAPESKLIEYYKSIPCMTNSLWIKDFIKEKTGKNAILQYQGIDLDIWKNEKPWEEREDIIGGLYSERHKTKNHYILEQLEEKGYKVKMLNRDIKHPSSEQLKYWYNEVKIWISTSVLEGLHNPPMEAGLCGCPLLTNDHPRNGTNDYACHESSRYFMDNALEDIGEDLQYLLDNPQYAIESNRKLQEAIKMNIGSREENMEKMLNIFSL